VLPEVPARAVIAVEEGGNNPMFTHSADCGCCRTAMLPPGFDRRGFLRFAAAGTAGLALAPRLARAQSQSPYKAMLLSCVDPRTQAPIADWMNQPAPDSHTASLKGQYSQFTIAGAAVGVIAPAFKAWRETFWDNFGASIQLHSIENLVVVDHSNCGALGIAYGQEVLNNPKLELEAHMADVTALKRELAIRHKGVAFQAWYVARDAAGSFTMWKNLIPGPVIA
jgi:carbonic anhydrase